MAMSAGGGQPRDVSAPDVSAPDVSDGPEVDQALAPSPPLHDAVKEAAQRIRAGLERHSLAPPASAAEASPVEAPAIKPSAPVRTPIAVESRSPVDDIGIEIDLDRRHVRGAGLLVAVALAFLSMASYSIGKAAATRSQPRHSPAAAVARPVAQATIAPQPGPVQVPDPAPVPLPVPAPPPVLATAPAKAQAPLFAEPAPGRVYLQVGVVQKGMAATWAEGLRMHGLDAFVAPGPAQNWGKVEIGPLPDQRSFQQAKDKLDKLGISAFTFLPQNAENETADSRPAARPY